MGSEGKEDFNLLYFGLCTLGLGLLMHIKC